MNALCSVFWTHGTTLRAGLVSLLALFSRDGAVAGEPPPRFFPLDAGRVWSLGDLDSAWRYEVIVLAREGDVALVRFQFVHPYGYYVGLLDVRFRERGPEIDVELGDEGFLPFYRFDEESFYHRDWHICRDDVTVRLTESVTMDVPAGTFTDCVLIGFPLKCADGGTRYQGFCPDTGPVVLGEGSAAGTTIWYLQAFEPTTKPFIRGDANVDGAVNLADAFAIFNTLFIYGSFHYLACEDAADANDDGAVNIADAIFTLNYLFIGGRPIPPPNACNFPAPGTGEPPPIEDFDPTPDDVHCASFPWCCNLPDCR
jgi:hypothetical protein